MGNDLFDPKSIWGTGDFKKSWDTGTAIARGIGSWSLKRRLQREGWDAITIDAALAAHKEGRDPEAVLEAARLREEARHRQAELRRNPPAVHGSARFAQVEELAAAGLLAPQDGTKINLGKVNGQSINWGGEGHLLTVAPTRTGKATMQIVPNLLRYKGSAVVLDPKGELYAATGKWRQKHVGPVYVLNPFGSETHAFNPLDAVTDNLSAAKLAETIFPRSGDDRQAFFDNEAIGFLTAVIEFTARYMTGSDRTLGAIRDDVSSLSRTLYRLVETMTDKTMSPSIQNAANNFLSKSRDTGRPRVIDSLNHHLRIWDSPGLRRATARTDFRFEDLKDNPSTVYLVLPFAEIEAYSTFVRMVFATALNAMLANAKKPDIPVLFVLDEFLALDADDRFISALRTHASAGVRLWFFLQDIATLEQKYPHTWKSFLQAEVKTFFGTDDYFTAKMISEAIGETTIAHDQPNISATASGAASYSLSNQVQLTARRLLTPDEVQQHLAGTSAGRPALHQLKNLRWVTSHLTPYFSDPSLEERRDTQD